MPAPINVSELGQTKKGNLIIEGLNALNQPYLYSLLIPNGNVGIGTANPSEKLQIVGGKAKADDFCLNDGVTCLSTVGGGVATPPPSNANSQGFVTVAATDLAVSGNVAYTSSYGNVLSKIDISSPNSPSIVKTLNATDGRRLSPPPTTSQSYSSSLRSFFLSGDRLYTAIDDGLEIVSLADPANPIYLGKVLNSPSTPLKNPVSLFVAGNYAYMLLPGSINTAMVIYDVSNAASPTFKGSIVNGVGGAVIPNASIYGEENSSRSRRIAVAGGNAYVVSTTDGSPRNVLEVIDVSNPSSPTHKTVLLLPPYQSGGAAITSKSVAVSGGYALISSEASNFSTSLDIVDISDPSNPVFKTRIDLGLTGAGKVQVSGNYAYIHTFKNPNSGDSPRIQIVDISDPLNLVKKGSFAGGLDFQIEGQYGYVLTDKARFTIVDISNPNAPVLKTTLVRNNYYEDGAGMATAYAMEQFRIAVLGNYAYIFSRRGVDVFNVSDRSNPVKVSYLYDKIGGIKGAWFSNSPTNRLYISGNKVFVLSNEVNVLEILENDEHKASLSHGNGGASLGNPVSLSVSGNYAYVMNYTVSFGGTIFEVVDITDISNPKHKSSLTLSFEPKKGVFSGGYLYVIGNGTPSSLAVIDVLNPVTPKLANVPRSSFFTSVATDIFVNGNYAYVLDGTNLVTVDVSNPSDPKIIGKLMNGQGGAVLNSPSSISVSGRYAFVADKTSNLVEIIDVLNPALPKHYNTIKNGDYGAKLLSPTRIVTQGNYAYVLSSGGLQILGIGSILASGQSSQNNVANVSSAGTGDGFKSIFSWLFNKPEKNTAAVENVGINLSGVGLDCVPKNSSGVSALASGAQFELVCTVK